MSDLKNGPSIEVENTIGTVRIDRSTRFIGNARCQTAEVRRHQQMRMEATADHQDHEHSNGGLSSCAPATGFEWESCAKPSVDSDEGQNPGGLKLKQPLDEPTETTQLIVVGEKDWSLCDANFDEIEDLDQQEGGIGDGQHQEEPSSGRGTQNGMKEGNEAGQIARETKEKDQFQCISIQIDEQCRIAQ